MAFQVTEEALAKLEALDDAAKRTVLAKLSGEERAQVVAALPGWRTKQSQPTAETKPGPKPSWAESLASGAGQAALGFGDELGALGQAELEGLSGLADVARGKKPVGQVLEDAVGTYRTARGENRQIDEAARKNHPGWYYGGLGAGTLATAGALPTLRAAQGAGAGTRILVNAVNGIAQGGAYGAGASEADLTQGEEGRFARDVATSSGVGGAAGGVLGGIGAAVSGLRNRAGRGLSEALEAERAVQERLAEKNIKSALGSYRSSIQSASRDLEVLEREAAQGTDDVAVRARAWLQTPEAQGLRAQVAGSKLGTAPERISEMDAARAQYQQLAAGKEANVEAQTAEALSNPVRKHVAPRLLTLGHRALPPLIAAAGGALGGTEGAIAGGVVGGIMSLTQGLPGRIVKNLIEKPAVRKVFWERVLSMSGGATEGNMAAVNALEAAAQRGPAALSAAFEEIRGSAQQPGAEAPPDRAKALRKGLE